MDIEHKHAIPLWWAWLVYFFTLFAAYWVNGFALLWLKMQDYTYEEWILLGLVTVSVINFIIGIVLLRYFLPRLGLDWHPMHNTVDDVAGAKISSIFFWWISWPILFIKLFFARL